MNRAIHSHWCIENRLHWELDVIFNEDNSQKKKVHTAVDFNMVVKVLKRHLLCWNRNKSLKSLKMAEDRELHWMTVTGKKFLNVKSDFSGLTVG
jgi:hypothetical protein